LSDPVPNAFLGTSEFAVEVLRALAGSPHRPVLVVTPPDRPRGRGRRLASPPVAEAAAELGLPLHQTARVSEEESVRELERSGARIGCVCAFGQLIKEPLLSELPMLNVHPSLLPRWRGAAPIERAIMAGDEETGVCVMRLTEGLDSGPVALSGRVAIEPTEDYGRLSARLAKLGGRLLVRALDLEAAGGLEFRDQLEDGVTYAEKISAADRRLDPRLPAATLARTVRALTPHVGAFFELEGGERLGICEAAVADRELVPGAVEVDDGALVVGCGGGALAIERLKPPGGREMSSAEYLRGHRPPAGLEAG
jgi:methionyl-tRNA formyltransferase